MKVSSALIPVEKSDDIEEVDFTIESTPAAFEILSAGIYTDRVTAVIRELGCNAYDAHIDGKNPDPFEVQLPNSLTPTFTLRDKGTGLPPEMVKKLYTRYFKSTKTHSDDFVGFMGLGSKSPFAYVDSFNVVSYWNGVKYMFSAFKNEIKKPSIALLGEEPTTERNGIEISFPVKKYDYNEFQQKAKDVFKFFKQKPIVKGVHNFEIPEIDYLLKGEGWAVTAQRDETNVVMGNVGYTFSYSDFENTENELSVRERKLVAWGVHLFVKIGSVTPAASREQITWTPAARELVKNLLAEALAAIEKQAQDALINAKTIWEARKALGKVKSGILAEVTDIDDKVKWGNMTIRENVHVNDYQLKPRLVECLSTDSDGYSRRGRRYGQSNYNMSSKQSGSLSRWTVDNFGIDIKVIFINDLNRGGYIASKRYMEEHRITKAIMFSDAPQSFIDEVGCAHLLVKTSSLPKPPRAARGSLGSGRADRTTVQLWNDYGSWTDCQVDATEGGVYLEVRRDKVKYKVESDGTFNFISPRSVASFLDSARALGFDEPLYVIRPCDLTKITKHENWCTLYEWIEDTLKQRSDLVAETNMKLTYEQVKHCMLAYFVEHKNKFHNDSPLHELIDLYLKLKNSSSNKEINSFIELNKVFHTYDLNADSKIVKKLDIKLENYPLLQFLGGDLGYSVACRNNAIEYINMIDELNLSKTKVA